MVSIKQAINDLNQCTLVQYDRLPQEVLAQEEMEPSFATTCGEIITYLKQLEHIVEQLRGKMCITMEQPQNCFNCPACVSKLSEDKFYCCLGAKNEKALTKEELFQLGCLPDCKLIKPTLL